MNVIMQISMLVVPVCIVMLGLCLLLSKKDMFDEFTKGATAGMKTAVRLVPTLVALLCAISMFNASGVAEYITNILSPICERIGLPSEALPFVVVRPLSGGVSTALIADVFKNTVLTALLGGAFRLLRDRRTHFCT